MATAPIASISDYLLTLYARAGDAEPDGYSAFALAGLCRLLRVDKAWWGLFAVSTPRPRLLNSFRCGLPDHYEAAWEDIKDADPLAKAVVKTQNQTMALNTAEIPRGTNLRGFATEFDLRHVMCTSVGLPEQDALMFVSVYRGERQSLFSAGDRAANQLLMPHLHSAWKQNLRERLRARSDGGGRDVRRAFVDGQGRVAQCDPGFCDLVAKRWRAWRGAALPTPLRAAIGAAVLTPGAWHGEPGWAVSAKPAGLLTLVDYREATPLDRLSPRERAVAVLFARGLTHKQIASELDLMPTTVRHYVREVYAKLLVDNKAALAGLVASGGRG